MGFPRTSSPSTAKRYKTFRPAHAGRSDRPYRQNGRVVGFGPTTPDGTLTIRADLVVGCRRTPFDRAREIGLARATIYGAPIDVLWLRLSRSPSDSAATFGHIEAGTIMVMLDRGDYWQCAFVIPKGGIRAAEVGGPGSLPLARAEMSPFLPTASAN